MSLFYQSENIQIIPSGEQPLDIPNVQSYSTSFTVQRQDVSRLGRFAPKKHRQSNQDPIVSLNVEFIPTGKNVEEYLGLTGPNSVVDYLVSGQYGKKIVDYKIQAKDLFGDSDLKGTIYLNSGVVNNYSFQASVGQTPRTSFSVECLDMAVDTDSTIIPQSFVDDYPALRSQDIEIILPTGVIGVKTIHPQSISLSIPLQRTQVFRIGDSKAYVRNLQAPIIAQFQVNAIVESFENTNPKSGNSIEFGSLACGGWLEDNIEINVKNPSCGNNTSGYMIRYLASKPYIDSFSMSNSVGGYTAVDLQFSVPVTFERGSGDTNLVIY